VNIQIERERSVVLHLFRLRKLGIFLDKVIFQTLSQSYVLLSVNSLTERIATKVINFIIQTYIATILYCSISLFFMRIKQLASIFSLQNEKQEAIKPNSILSY